MGDNDEEIPLLTVFLYVKAYNIEKKLFLYVFAYKSLYLLKFVAKAYDHDGPCRFLKAKKEGSKSYPGRICRTGGCCAQGNLTVRTGNGTFESRKSKSST